MLTIVIYDHKNLISLKVILKTDHHKVKKQAIYINIYLFPFFHEFFMIKTHCTHLEKITKEQFKPDTASFGQKSFGQTSVGQMSWLKVKCPYPFA